MRYVFVMAAFFALSYGATIKHTSVGLMKHIVHESGKASVVMLGSVSCPFCVTTEESMKELSYVYDAKVNFLSIDIEQFPEAAKEFGVKATPTLLFYGKEGNLLERRTGGLTQRGFEKKFAEFGIIP